MIRVRPRRLLRGLALAVRVAGPTLVVAPMATYARPFVTPCHRPVSPSARRHLLVRVDSCRSRRRSTRPLTGVRVAGAVTVATQAVDAAPPLAVAIVAVPHTLTPVITALNPRPGATLTATGARAYVAARVEAAADLRRVEVRLDGRRVSAEVMGRDAAEASVLYQPRRWAAGRHCAEIRAWDMDGQVAGRAWCFTIKSALPKAGHTGRHDPVGKPGQAV